MSENERSSPTHALNGDEWIDLLRHGEVDVEGRMPWSSNATFLVSLSAPHGSGRAIYKPMSGEYPLWDFPEGIFRREVAAYELSAILGLEIVPQTIARTNAPFGEGSLQRFIEADFEQHYFTMMEHERHHERLREVAGFDLLANNADRKGGHLLIDASDHIYGIDHGLCFHVQPKLRTVMWDFAGEPIPQVICAAAEEVIRHFPEQLCSLLSPSEREALSRRAGEIISDPIFPYPDFEGRPYPWPRI